MVGRPIASSDADHQRLNKTTALAVFSSDAISSTAYATQEILIVTALATGSSLARGLDVLVPISIAVAILLAIVATSYSQTIHAYPSGGGSYVVSRENLGERASLVAGASLLVDYILTVAVSICAGVRAITSIPAFQGLVDWRVAMGVAAIVFITLMNLRGVKESGRIFAVPTYVYIIVLAALVGLGLGRSLFDWFGGIDRIDFHSVESEGLRESGESLGVFLILKGFSSGAVALTGVEAISNGVPAFRRPESRNASITLTWMAVILGSLFFCVSLLASRLHPIPSEAGESVFSQMGRHVFGEGPVYLLLQFATAGILLLAANTAYADFPRLSSLIARDGYLPRQLSNRGDRLVFSNGVLVLAAAAIALVVIFGGNESRLIPLYAVGVFTSFSLSQAGMVRHHLKEREPRWRLHLSINAVGAFATTVVLGVVAYTKFRSGAWVSIVVVLVIIFFFRAVKGHYAKVAAGLRISPDYRPRRMNHTVIVLVGNLHRGTLEALAYAKSLAPNHLVAVTVVSDEDEERRIQDQWAERGLDVSLDIVHSPYRELATPILRYIDELDALWENDIVTVVLPEFVVQGWFSQLLHNQTALLLKARLLFRKHTVVTSVPYHLDA
jgi:amino acid transporter